MSFTGVSISERKTTQIIWSNFWSNFSYQKTARLSLKDSQLFSLLWICKKIMVLTSESLVKYQNFGARWYKWLRLSRNWESPIRGAFQRAIKYGSRRSVDLPRSWVESAWRRRLRGQDEIWAPVYWKCTNLKKDERMATWCNFVVFYKHSKSLFFVFSYFCHDPLNASGNC